MTKVAIIVLALAALVSPAFGQSPVYYASPSGVDNNACSQAQPCTPEGAYVLCHITEPTGDLCEIQLADGTYLDPGINLYYYRFATLRGNCSNPSSVTLVNTKPGMALIWVQDHAIAAVKCLRLEGHVGGTSGIVARQHVIVDYDNLIFGNMPGGSHISMNDFSIASCTGPVAIAGNATVHAAASNLSKINLGCEMNINGVFGIDFFVVASRFSIVDASAARFTGSYFVSGIACFQTAGLVDKAAQAFPGSSPGNCP